MTGAVLVAIVLLAWAGVAKAWRPEPTARALAIAGLAGLAGPAGLAGSPGRRRLVRLPRLRRLRGLPGLAAGPALVRALATVEAAIAVGAFVRGGLFAAAMGCSYAAFALFVGVALRRGRPLSSCGCFGVADARPTAAHFLVNVVLAVASFAYAAGGSRPVAYLSGHPAVGAALGLVAVVTAGLVVAVLSVLPTVTAT